MMSSTGCAITRSPEETMLHGEAIAGSAASGLVIALSGDLGAGKTQLVRGIARGLGVEERVHSPTFTLLNEYRSGRLRLFHLDLYRLNSSEEVISAGLDLYLETPDGLTVVEWPERWFGEAPTPRLATLNLTWLQIDILDESSRRISCVHPRS